MTTITLTPHTDAAPSPRIEVQVSGMTGATATVTRTADGRAMPVRGAVLRSTAGGFDVLDMEAPFGVSCTYTVQEFDSAGAPAGFTSSDPATLDVTETWVHQPLDQRLALPAALTDRTAQDLSRGFDATTVYPDGASVGVVVSGRRRGLEGVVVEVETDTDADAAALQAMLGTYTTDQVPVLCIRTPPGYTRLPRTLFLACANPVESDVNVRYGGHLTTMTLTGDEVRPPAAALSVPLLRYQDTDGFYGSYAAIDAAYGTYSARDRDWEKAGFAG